MKKIFILGALLISGLTFAQTGKPFLEQEGNLVKATYYYENGKVQQQGYFKDGKITGQWVAFDENGNKKLDKNFVGMPLEGYGVSNNIRHMMSAPEFKESSFQVNGEVDKNIKIRMGY